MLPEIHFDEAIQTRLPKKPLFPKPPSAEQLAKNLRMSAKLHMSNIQPPPPPSLTKIARPNRLAHLQKNLRSQSALRTQTQTQHSELRTQNSGLSTQDSALRTQNSGLSTSSPQSPGPPLTPPPKIRTLSRLSPHRRAPFFLPRKARLSNGGYHCKNGQ